MTWRNTEPDLVLELPDADIVELMDLIEPELPFSRARDGTVDAWILRAEHSSVIATSDRIEILRELRAARQKLVRLRAVSA